MGQLDVRSVKGESKIAFQKRDLKGSRLRCLMLTSLPRKEVARRLTELVQPYGVVDSQNDGWMPRGFLEPDEARLGEIRVKDAGKFVEGAGV